MLFPAGLLCGLSQMNIDELNRFANNPARSFVIILIVETVNALRMIGKIKRYVFGKRFANKPVNRIVHRRDLIASGASNKDRRDIIRGPCYISYLMKLANRVRLFTLPVSLVNGA